MVSENITDLCLEQHGEAARAYIEKATLLTDMCLLPNFGMPLSLVQHLTTILQIEKQFGEATPGVGFVKDIKIFAKPQYSKLNLDNIRQADIVELFNWIKELYPQETTYLEIGEFWDVLDIFRRGQKLNQSQFITWFKELFLGDKYYQSSNIEGSKILLVNRNERLKQVLKSLLTPIFQADSSIATIYCLADDSNENTAFAPYIIIGDNSLLVVLKEWSL